MIEPALGRAGGASLFWDGHEIQCSPMFVVLNLPDRGTIPVIRRDWLVRRQVPGIAPGVPECDLGSPFG
jgi:hypothetical protein